MNKKALLTIGSIFTPILPIITVVACNSSSSNSKDKNISIDKNLFYSFRPSVKGNPIRIPKGNVTAKTLNNLDGITLPPLTPGITRKYTIDINNNGNGSVRVDFYNSKKETDYIHFEIKGFQTIIYETNQKIKNDKMLFQTFSQILKLEAKIIPNGIVKVSTLSNMGIGFPPLTDGIKRLYSIKTNPTTGIAIVTVAFDSHYGNISVNTTFTISGFIKSTK